jgi:hypothetical protein
MGNRTGIRTCRQPLSLPACCFAKVAATTAIAADDDTQSADA